MADRALLFSAPMVRALLEGRKSQTRRVLKIRGHKSFYEFGPSDTSGYNCRFRDGEKRWYDMRHSELMPRLPFVIGDRIWVRETWQGLSIGEYLPTKSKVCDLRYRATAPLADLPTDVRGDPWRPAIHIPRWASRVTLTVANVGVERLQGIDGHDAAAEGACEFAVIPLHPADLEEARQYFRDLWNSIHGADAWAANPWICAISFNVHKCNIDELHMNRSEQVSKANS